MLWLLVLWFFVVLCFFCFFVGYGRWEGVLESIKEGLGGGFVVVGIVGFGVCLVVGWDRCCWFFILLSFLC